MSTKPSEYVLGTGADELARLGLQARLWGDAAHRAWRRARIAPPQRILDVGCGPGYASMDLAYLVTGAGEVVGVDESAAYIEWMNGQCSVRGLRHARGIVGDVQSLDKALPGKTGYFDAAYARWVLCFVPRPQDVVRHVASLLKPGGRFVVHDYFNYTAMAIAPKRPAFDKAVQATKASWHDRGGDTDIIGRLPALLANVGMRVEHLDVHQRIARGHPDPRQRDTMFTWVDVWWRVYAPKLVQMGRLSQADCDQLMRDLDEAGSRETEFVVCPPVYELIAVKA